MSMYVCVCVGVCVVHLCVQVGCVCYSAEVHLYIKMKNENTN